MNAFIFATIIHSCVLDSNCGLSKLIISLYDNLSAHSFMVNRRVCREQVDSKNDLLQIAEKENNKKKQDVRYYHVSSCNNSTDIVKSLCRLEKSGLK